MLKRGISITSYNRPHILNKTLRNLSENQSIDNYNIIIVQQNSNKDYENIINSYNFKNLTVLRTEYPNKWSPYKKMTLNGLKGFQYCFEKLKCDIGFYLEDDIFIAKDFFLFGEHILAKYKQDKKFFAVNSFSNEPYTAGKSHLYSKFIYGIGKGWGINKEKWEIIKKLWNKKLINSLHPEYDYPIENYIKKKNYYVVMPICSRTYELKSSGVSIKESDKDYFINFRKSFVKNNNKYLKYKYTFFSKYNWRKDCKKYKGFLLEFFLSKVQQVSINFFKYFISK